MFLPISRPVRKTPQTRRPTARKSASRRALPSACRIAYNRPSALRGSAPAPQHSGGRMPRKSTVRASINPSRLTRRSSGTLRQQAGLRPSTLRYSRIPAVICILHLQFQARIVINPTLQRPCSPFLASQPKSTSCTSYAHSAAQYPSQPSLARRTNAIALGLPPGASDAPLLRQIRQRFQCPTWTGSAFSCRHNQPRRPHSRHPPQRIDDPAIAPHTADDHARRVHPDDPGRLANW